MVRLELDEELVEVVGLLLLVVVDVVVVIDVVLEGDMPNSCATMC